MGKQEDNDSEGQWSEIRLSSPPNEGRESEQAGDTHSHILFLIPLLYLCVSMHTGRAIVSLSLCAYIRACHSQHVRAVCTFALLRSSPEVVL